MKVIYEGKIYYGDGDIDLPFKIKYFEDNNFEITRTDGLPFEDIFYPDYKYYRGNEEINNLSQENKEGVEILKSDFNQKYMVRSYSGEDLKTSNLLKIENKEIESLRYMVKVHSCHLNRASGTFYLAGDFFIDTVNIDSILNSLRGSYNLTGDYSIDELDLEGAIRSMLGNGY
jgi:hypothetical protein